MWQWLHQLLFGPERPRTLEPTPRRGATPAQPPPATSSRASHSSRPRSAPPQSATLNLDAGAFAPASDEETRRRAEALRGGFLWLFGRRDIIPPAEDQRTQIIDRAMVAHGFISSEELAQIHAIGAEMDALRPDPAVAASLARQQIARDDEARKELKARKKAEAAGRKRQHAEAVAHRKRTDIIYLGRGVSAGLADRAADADRLTAAGLPVLATPADIAAALGIDIPRLRWLAFHAEAPTTTHYIRFTIPKRSGGLRELAAPAEQLAAAQEWILTSILEKVPTHDAAHGFVQGRSTVTNAAPHVGRSIIVNADLKDFFPSITFPRVLGLFKWLGYSPAAATVLALLCTESPRKTVSYAGTLYHVATGTRALPQGACTSPALSNLIARGLDARLAGIALKLGWSYTRYADDLTFSADAPAADQAGYLLARIRHIAQDEGFAVNEDKTHIQRPHMQQTVTGIVVNRRPGVDRDVVRRLRAILHQAKRTGLEAQNREKLPHFKAWLRGMIAYVHMVNPDQARPLYEAFREVT